MPRLLLSFALITLMAACTASPEYPGVKTNVTIGRAAKPSNYPVSKNFAAPQPTGEGILHTKELPSGDKSICVGNWCSCASE